MRRPYRLLKTYRFIPNFRPSYLGWQIANFARASSSAAQKLDAGLKCHIPHQPKVQRLIKRDYDTSCEMVLLRISAISVAYSLL